MVVGSFEPAAPKPLTDRPASGPRHSGSSSPTASRTWFGLDYKHYPIVYTVKIALTIAAMLFVLPGYRQFPFRISPLAIVVGVVGVVLWIWICSLHLEPKLLAPLGLDWLRRPRRAARRTTRSNNSQPRRPGPTRFWPSASSGLALVVPIIEEFFLRGFLMRFVQDERLVGSPLRRSDAAGRRRRHRRPDADAPGRAAGRRRLVQPGHLADDPHPQHLGLRRRPRRHEPAAWASTSSRSTSGNSGRATEAAELARMR